MLYQIKLRFNEVNGIHAEPPAGKVSIEACLTFLRSQPYPAAYRVAQYAPDENDSWEYVASVCGDEAARDGLER